MNQNQLPPQINIEGILFYSNDIIRIIHNQINMRMVEVEEQSFRYKKSDGTSDGTTEICKHMVVVVAIPYEIPLDDDDRWVVEDQVRDFLKAHGWLEVYFQHCFKEPLTRESQTPLCAFVTIDDKIVEFPIQRPFRNTTILTIFA